MTINLYFTGGGIASIVVAVAGIIVGAAGVWYARRSSEAAMKLANKEPFDPNVDRRTGRYISPAKRR